MSNETTMTPAEVLAVLDEAASACACERDQHDANDAKPYADTWEKRRAKLRASHTAVAELIAADVEYDEAQKSWSAKPFPENWERVKNALDRRAAALAACSGLA